MFFISKGKLCHLEEKLACLERDNKRLAEEKNALEVQAKSDKAALVEIRRQMDLGNSLMAGLGQFGASLSAVKHSVSELSNMLGLHRHEALQTKKESARARDSMTVLAEALGVARDSASSSASQVDTLECGTQDVTKLVGVIGRVSDQTSLLALNASIEAARAGEHGRGFSVVATEVRNLASLAGESTKEIENAIGTIREQAMTVAKVCRADSHEIERLAKDAEAARESLMTLISMADASSETLGGASLMAELDLANLEELEVKLTVYQVIAGLLDVSAVDLPDETECRFGQWYYNGDGHEHYAKRPEFRAIEGPHRLVHVYAKEAVVAHQEGRLEDSMKALKLMEDNNIDVMTRLRLLGEHSGHHAEHEKQLPTP